MSHKLLQVLEGQINELANTMAPVADRPASQARFDQQLFANHGTRLRDYLAEVRKNMAQLSTLVEQQRNEQVAFMANKLVTQIGALQRELATHNLRKAEVTKVRPQEDLYQKLSEHQGYERRLLAMISDRESQLGQQTTLAAQQRMQQELAAIEGRLVRCRQALTRIERNIERQENSSPY